MSAKVVPLNPCLGISCFSWRLIVEGWPRRKPFSRAEKPPIVFICELEKQVRIGPFLRGEGKFAISDRANAAHGISDPNATRPRFKYRREAWFRAARRACHGAPLLRRVQVALKPASKTFGSHGVFIRSKGLKYAIADSAFKRLQVDARARQLDTDEHHRGPAFRTGGTPNCGEWNNGRQVLRL